MTLDASLVVGDTHVNVIRGRLRRYRDSLIDAWLAELEELGFIEVARTSAAYDLDLQPLVDQAASAGDLIEFPDELQQIADEARAAGEALHGKGAYLATARLQNREPLAKDPSQVTVLLVEDDPDQAALADLRISMAGRNAAPHQVRAGPGDPADRTGQRGEYPARPGPGRRRLHDQALQQGRPRRYDPEGAAPDLSDRRLCSPTNGARGAGRIGSGL